MKYTNKQRQELYNYFFKYTQSRFFIENSQGNSKAQKAHVTKNGVDGLEFGGLKSDKNGGYTLKITSPKNSFTFSIHGSDLLESGGMFSIFGRFEHVDRFNEINKNNLEWYEVNVYSGKCNFHDSFSTSCTMTDAKQRIRNYFHAILGGL